MAGWQPKEHGINAAQLVVDMFIPCECFLEANPGKPKTQTCCAPETHPKKHHPNSQT